MEDLQFLPVALPIMIMIAIVGFVNHRAVDGIRRRVDDVAVRLGRIANGR